MKDTGIGLEPASLSTLFKPFHQADDTVASRYGGTGLGLSISKSLAELMGGQIEVASAPGDGTTFTLRLPLQVVDTPSRTVASSAGTTVVLVATRSVGLLRHLRSRLEELGREFWQARTFLMRQISGSRRPSLFSLTPPCFASR